MTAVAQRSDAQRVKELARALGFDLCRIAPATPLHTERERYLTWLEGGRQGSMRWMTPERAEISTRPAAVLPGARAVVCVGLSYWAGHRQPTRPLEGRIARYAWGADYHAVLGERLTRLAERLNTEFGAESRAFVDTGPAMDKALAARAGLGWYGKNTNLLTERFGSFVLLGELLTTLDLPADAPLTKDCGACRLCVVACPTGALGPEYTIDARRCISYLTIEHRGAIPRELRAAIGDWVFGCDICQDVCPPTIEPHLTTTGARRAWTSEVRRYTTGASLRRDEAPGPEAGGGDAPDNPLFSAGARQSVDLLSLLRLTHEEYLHQFRGTAVRRAKVWMLRRNAAVALGNVGDKSCVPALRMALLTDEHPLVRSHAAWALGRIGARDESPACREALETALEGEHDAEVRAEVEAALYGRSASGD